MIQPRVRLAERPESPSAAALYSYSATDAYQESVTLEFGIEVVASALALADAIADQTFKQGIPITDLVLPAAVGGTPPYEYALTPALPPGLSFDAAARTISGTPAEAMAPATYTYAVADAASSSATLQFAIEVISSVASEQAGELPGELTVRANFPNPFTTTTTLVFDLPDHSEVSVTVTDLLGRRQLSTEALPVPAGWSRTLVIDGQGLPAGAYVYRLVARTAEGQVVRTGALFRVK